LRFENRPLTSPISDTTSKPQPILMSARSVCRKCVAIDGGLLSYSPESPTFRERRSSSEIVKDLRDQFGDDFLHPAGHLRHLHRKLPVVLAIYFFAHHRETRL
jgi:hypothetical protein